MAFFRVSSGGTSGNLLNIRFGTIAYYSYKIYVNVENYKSIYVESAHGSKSIGVYNYSDDALIQGEITASAPKTVDVTNYDMVYLKIVGNDGEFGIYFTYKS